MKKCVVCESSVVKNAGTNRHPACPECVKDGSYQSFMEKVSMDEAEDRMRTVKDRRGKRNIFVSR